MRAFFVAPLALAAACGAAPLEGDAAGSQSQATFSEGSCAAHQSNLIAGQSMDAGGVSISNDDTNLYVEVSTQEGWCLTESHIYAGTGAIPVNRKGIPVPGQFPYKNSFSPGVASYTEVIPLASLGVGCDGTLKVAVHTVVQRSVGGRVEQQTAWADGQDFGTPRWAWYTVYAGCCEPLPPGQCVEPVAFWAAADPATWPVDLRGWVFCYSAALGPVSASQMLAQAPSSFFVELSQQYLAALENSVCLGTDCVTGAAFSRTNYLTNDCVIDESEQAEAEQLYALWSSYNSGSYQTPQGACW